MYAVIVLLSVVSVLLLLWWLKRNYDIRKVIDKFPGRPYNYFLGHVIHFSLQRDKFFVQVRELFKEFPDGYTLWAGFFGALNFVRADDAEAILSSPKYIEKSPLYEMLECWLDTGLLTSGGKKWHQRRKLLTPAFHFNILKQFVTIFGEHGKSFVRELDDECAQPKTNIVPLISKLTLNIICETAMGITLNSDDKKQVKYRDAVHGLGPLIVTRPTRPWLYFNFIYNLTSAGKQTKEYVKTLHEFTTSVIKERESTFTEEIITNINEVNSDEFGYNKQKRFAMLDLLISAKRNNAEIDDIGIREEVDTFMFEGHDTTSMALCFALLMLANHKDVQERARAELDEIFQRTDRAANYLDLQNMQYLDMVIKETLRLYPSVPFISRTIAETLTFREGKYQIPAGGYCHLHVYDLHRDSRVFTDPERFDPDRFLPENVKGRHPYAYIPFSAGPRNCIGQKFAMLEMKSVLSSVLRYYELDPIDSPEDIVMMIDLVLRPKNGVHIKFKSRL